MKLGPKFQDIIPGSDLEAAREYLDNLDWNLSFQETNGQWMVFSGNVLLLSATEKSELIAFVIGMALSLAILPSEIQDRIKDLFTDK